MTIEKAFSKPITDIQADYLDIIYDEFLATGQARACAIATSAGVSNATVTATMRSLRSLGLIDYQPYGPITLTEEGKTIASTLRSRRLVIESFLVDVIGLPKDEATRISQANKRLWSDDSIEKLKAFGEKVQAG